MKPRTVRKSVTLVGGVAAVAVALAGCGDTKAGSKASGASSDVTASPGASTGAATPGKAGPETAPTHVKEGERGGTAAHCESAALGAEFQRQPWSGRGHVFATLILTNRSAKPCTLAAGWATFGKGAGGKFTELRTTRAEMPGEGSTITLKPGTSAFEGVKYDATDGCPSIGGFGVRLRGGWIDVRTPGRRAPIPLCPDSFTAGTIQPAMNGVNFRH
ncbi:DUF4232 domain-containing protein [Actinomadura gamaensis]|uniref:DUF4232 domain-containing protein n=1 Tax=Actinomadura gamaensis TaxID=1763541 RepID=A0ABV9U2H1_9ACTN